MRLQWRCQLWLRQAKAWSGLEESLPKWLTPTSGKLVWLLAGSLTSSPWGDETASQHGGLLPAEWACPETKAMIQGPLWLVSKVILHYFYLFPLINSYWSHWVQYWDLLFTWEETAKGSEYQKTRITASLSGGQLPQEPAHSSSAYALGSYWDLGTEQWTKQTNVSALMKHTFWWRSERQYI